MQEAELKHEFAKLFLKLSDPFKAGLALFPDDVGTALKCAFEWQKDPLVLEAKSKLADEYENDLLPSKAEYLNDIWDTMHDPKITFEDFTKMAKLYADVRGFIEKPQPAVAASFTSNKVMIINQNGSDSEWEDRMRLQQTTLIDAQ